MRVLFERLPALSLCLLLALGLPSCLLAQGVDLPNEAPVPGAVDVVLNASQHPLVTWNTVPGHGPQTGLHTTATFNYSGYTVNLGVDQVTWAPGDPNEFRSVSNQNTHFYSSYGADIVFFNSSGGPDAYPDIFSFQHLEHAPQRFLPATKGGTGPAKYDQVHYFNADPTTTQMDMIDLSPLGVTHPDQLTWLSGDASYQYSYLIINDNNASADDLASALNIRWDRTFGTFDLVDNIIYATGQTTYTVYRRREGTSTFTMLASGLTTNSYEDLSLTNPSANYIYYVTATDMFGESDASSTVSLDGTGLPIQWGDMMLTPIGAQQVQLSWSTLFESQNAGFEIERSLDGRQFVAVGYVVGQGDSDTVQSYRWADQQAPLREVFYRIKQIDLDGAFSYSHIQALDLSISLDAAIKVFPNPGHGYFLVKGLQPHHRYVLQLYNAHGKQVYHRALPLEMTHLPKCEVGHLQPGAYLLRVISLDEDEEAHVTVLLK